ncbi:carboxypeptidase regulatory-like domain-containing protein [Halomonas sp. YLGW01]|uniref:carboxypeptidase regulatory-like domain-containing protein n=1 Tax=Halomonas sp. YLGW01 TaxID=2773308 RepID=UPI0017872A29|nr:carboxypeptidase regulatory-like domain-containing protein [Halomonas sp. YLGW01]
MPRVPHVLLSILVLATVTLNSLDAKAARITVIDAATGQPLPDAVVEVDVADTPPADTASFEIFQRDAAFHPHVSAVPVGSRISFPNRDTTRHHVYSFSPTGVFDLNLYRQDTPPPVHFDRAGVAVLGCNIHDHMQAFIVVSDADYQAIADESGQVRLTDLPPGEHRLRVWHPRLDETHQQWWQAPTPITADDRRSVSLSLAVSPRPAPKHSSLQQRFNRALSQ